MFKGKKLTRRDKITIISLVAVLITATALIIGLASAKYVTQKHLSGKIGVSADLASGIEVFEHEVTRTPDGDYETVADSEVTTNVYTLMPGVDVPKDPTVRIKGYTGLAAWLYVEIVETDLPDTVTYTAADGWTLLTGLTGPNGGKIYYRELTNAQTGDLEFPVLANNTVIVSEKIPRGTTLKLDFYAYITQEKGTAAADFASFTANTTNP